MKRLAARVEMLDGRVLEAKTSTADSVLYEAPGRRQKPPWGGVSESPSQWEAFVSWAALRRTGQYADNFDAFLREVDLVDASQEETVVPTSAEAGADS